jgi:hypothetical protein
LDIIEPDARAPQKLQLQALSFDVKDVAVAYNPALGRTRERNAIERELATAQGLESGCVVDPMGWNCRKPDFGGGAEARSDYRPHCEHNDES